MEEYMRQEYIKLTLDSEYPPLELRYTQVNDCYAKTPIAYRTDTMVNSAILGRLVPQEYTFATDKTDRGIRLAKWSILEAMKAIEVFAKADRHVHWVSVRCPANMCTDIDLYEWMKETIEANHFTEPQKLCLEFPSSILFKNEAKARLTMLNMKLLNVKTMMSGCGANDCPMARLVAVPVDFVLLDPTVTVWAGNRDKIRVVPSMVQYLNSMNLEVYADGVEDDSQILALSGAYCGGYIPKKTYRGSVMHGELCMPLSDALKQREEEF